MIPEGQANGSTLPIGSPNRLLIHHAVLMRSTAQQTNLFCREHSANGYESVLVVLEDFVL
jgi:hypothetical protein